MKQFRIGIVGAGLIAKDHANSLTRNPRVCSITFFDTDTERARAAADLFGVPVAKSLRELVNQSDIIWICTPPFAHRAAILAACRVKRPIFCEKPLGINETDLRVIAAAVRRARVPFFMGQSGRYSYFFKKMKELVEDGAIGQPTMVWSTRLGYFDPKKHPAWRFDAKLGGGMLIEFGVHEIDFVSWLGGQWTSVSAVASSRILRPGNFVDTVAAVGTLRSGAIARVEIGWASPRYLWQRGVEGETGSLFLDDSKVREVNLLRPGKKPQIFRTGNWMDMRTKENLSLKDQATAVLDTLAKGGQPGVTLADGAAAVRAALAMYESTRTGRVVRI